MIAAPRNGGARVYPALGGKVNRSLVGALIVLALAGSSLAVLRPSTAGGTVLDLELRMTFPFILLGD